MRCSSSLRLGQQPAASSALEAARTEVAAGRSSTAEASCGTHLRPEVWNDAAVVLAACIVEE